jgi:phosphoglycolate phosphatase
MRPTVLLFDIDGTLITTGGVGRRALERAFETLHGAPGINGIRLDGMTDRAIVRAGLLSLGREVTDDRIAEILEAYVALLSEEVAAADPARYRVHQGMHEAVMAGLEHGCAVGLGTGNIRKGAQVKLARVGIYERFAFGGFGCDHEDRAELIRVGAQRGAAQLGAPLGECRVVVIGDTPKDVAAAKAISAECVGVGTGSFTAEQLLQAGADAAFTDLGVPGAIDRVLGR